MVKGLSPDEELADLQKKYQLLDGDRKAYIETSQWTIKQNRETLAALKRENKELRAQLAARAGERARNAEKLAGGSEELHKLQLFVTDLRKKYDDKRQEGNRKLSQMDQRIDSIRDLEKDAIRVGEEDNPMTRHIRMLENRLDKALIKYNEAQSIRRTYEQIVKRLREERIGFDNQLAAVERTLKAKEHDLEELVLMSHDANHAKEVAKSELMKVDGTLTQERASREKEIQERRAQVREKQKMNAQMEARDKKRKDIAAEAQGDLSVKEEQQMKKAVAANYADKLFNEEAKAQQEAEKERVTSFEDAFRKIKEATGVDDVSKMISKFLSQGEDEKNLTAMQEEKQSRIGNLNKEREQVKAKIEEMKYAGVGGPGSRRVQEEYEQQVHEASQRCEREKRKLEGLLKVVIDVKAGTEHLSDKLDGIKIEAPNIPISDETVVEVLSQCEQKLVKTLDVFQGDEDAARNAFNDMEKVKGLGLEDIPENNMRIESNLYGDEEELTDDEDEDDGNDQDPLPDRDFLKNKAQDHMDKSLGKKSKRGKKFMGNPGDMPTTPAVGNRRSSTRKQSVTGKGTRGGRADFA